MRRSILDMLTAELRNVQHLRDVSHMRHLDGADSMPDVKPSLETLGQLIAAKRGRRGIRAAAREIGVSPATLSRVENGHLPDLENFRLICKWLEVEPNQILGFASSTTSGRGRVRASVHFRKQRTTSPKTAAALANLILHVQRALTARGAG